MLKIIDITAATLLYFSIYLRDSLSQSFPNAIFLLALMSGLILISIRLDFKISNRDASILILSFFLLILNSIPKSGIQFSNYLLAPIIGFLIAKKIPEIFIKLLLFHMVISVAIQIYEYISGEYMFVISAEDGSVLNSQFFAGAAGVFRAKGMFQGPLSAVSFYLLMIFFLPSLRVSALALLGSILSYGRLGIIISFAIFANRILRNSGALLRLSALSILLLSSYFLISYLEGSFFISAFDLSSSGNSARTYYWTQSIILFQTYPLWNMFFGDLGYANEIGVFPESDFLRIILDCGIFGISFYISSLAILFNNLKKAEVNYSIIFSTILLSMSIFPLIQSLSSTVLFWFMFWKYNSIINNRQFST